jgi:uncharacterized protein YndB with AHSA1/START domain
MGNSQLTGSPRSRTEMLVRRLATEVFEAIADPALTIQFWFTRGSGRLEVGKPVQWDWEMYDVSVTVTPNVVKPNQRIVIEWPGYSGPATVEWQLTPQPDDTTFVQISEEGFTGDADELVRYVVDSTLGFTWMLAGMKALLEHGIRLNLTADANPKDLVTHRAGTRQVMSTPGRRRSTATRRVASRGRGRLCDPSPPAMVPRGARSRDVRVAVSPPSNTKSAPVTKPAQRHG